MNEPTAAKLGYLRRLAGAFAEIHPKIAGRLRLTRDTIDDPHVERLVEAVAFLNASRAETAASQRFRFGRSSREMP